MEEVKRKLNVLMIILVILVLAFLIFLLIRLFSIAKIDDVNPSRLCEKTYLDKSSILMIIPFSDNISISNNPDWCNYILSLNKTLGMHGVYHTEEEFKITRSESYIRTGMEEFKKCFGFYPSIFEAPELILSKANENLLKSMNFTIISSGWHIFHKSYHCVDSEKKSWLVNLNTLNNIF